MTSRGRASAASDASRAIRRARPFPGGDVFMRSSVITAGQAGSGTRCQSAKAPAVSPDCGMPIIEGVQVQWGWCVRTSVCP